MRNPTSRHLQIPKPLSTFQSDLREARHSGCALRHTLLSPLTLQIFIAIMVAHSAVGVMSACHQVSVFQREEPFQVSSPGLYIAYPGLFKSFLSAM